MKKRVIVIISIFALLIISSISIYALVSFNQKTNGSGNSTNVLNGGTIDVGGVNDETIKNKMITLNGIKTSDENDSSYMQNLKVNVNINVKMKARIRILLEDEWILTKTYINKVDTKVIPTPSVIPYTFADNWVFDYTSNYAYYLLDLEDLNKDLSISCVTKGTFLETASTQFYRETCTVNLKIQVEVIQANRAISVWGIDPATLSNTI